MAEILRPVYGLDDAGFRWWKFFTSWLESKGFKALRTDPNVYIMGGEKGDVLAILGLHVDDIACGGRGERWKKVFEELQAAFPRRSVRKGKGEILGSTVHRNSDYSIDVCQEKYAEGMKPTVKGYVSYGG